MNGVLVATSATGGSATSQAAWLDRRAWTVRWWLRASIRALMFLAPVQATVVMVRVIAAVVPRPGSLLADAVWFVLLMVVSVATAVGVQRLVQGLAPPRAMLMISLVLPDQTASKFRSALRSGTGRQLAQHAQGASGPERAAAEELVTLLARLNRHDRLTRGHTERVRAYAVMLGEQIGLTRDELHKLSWAALAHDMGKLEVPGEILNKPGRPTEAEWEVLRAHPGAGGPFVEPLRPWLGDWVDAATQHHERYDGNGYPQGLRGTDIGLAGRIVAIADAFDVMTAARSYKKPLPAAQARAELLNNAGTQFDPALVRSFLQISIGKVRWVVGPMGWLSNLPYALRAPMAGLAGGPGAIAAVAASALVVVPAITPPAPPDKAERSVAISMVDDDVRSRLESGGSGLVTVRLPGTVASTVPPSSSPTGTSSVAAPGSSTTTTLVARSSTPSTTTTTSTTSRRSGSMDAVDDEYQVSSTEKTVLHVQDNDDYGGVDPGDSALVTAPQQGSVEVVGKNMKYTPNPGAAGIDTFEYRACNAAGSCDVARVTVTFTNT